ncbi:ribosomal large subunit pseudouridine synthase D [Bacillus sp. JCM 19047]|nr:ribosomal large subunit pseudouridine synthase D [Bacillus sp. JCM 19047]
MNKKELKWRVRKSEANLSLRAFLREEKQLSKRLLSAIKFQGGEIFLNDVPVTVRAYVKEGDHVRVCLPNEQVSSSLKPQNIALTIHYEDTDLLVVEKPAMMATIPSHDHPDHTLANAVLNYYQKQDIAATFHAVNRLDRGTSGLIMIAKHRHAHDLLSKAQQQGEVKRYYSAVVTGVPKLKGTINAPIGRKASSIIEREVRADGKPALTYYRRIASNQKESLLQLELQTGRTHQIRVHLQSIGFPLLGDGLYGGDQRCFSHQALHCYQLTFTQPLTGERYVIKSPLPKAWKRVCADMAIEDTNQDFFPSKLVD